MKRFSLPHQCHGVTRRGKRCTISTGTPFVGSDGRDLSWPLRHGSDYCLVHLQALVSRPCSAQDEGMLFYIDFETSGLDIFQDHIVEIGLLCETGECFATVCCPPVMTPGPHVHGIPNDELALGPSFAEALKRMVNFLETLIVISVQNEDSSSEDDELLPLRFKECPPEVVIVAHNGYKFDFPFLLSECHRNDIDCGEFRSWRFADTLDLVRAMDPELFGGCQKLQCLRHCADIGEFQAHRALDCRSVECLHHSQVIKSSVTSDLKLKIGTRVALIRWCVSFARRQDDCRVLRAVVHGLAERHGVSPWQIVRPFIFAIDVDSTRANLSMLCEAI